jgi:hypothetical protein
LTRRFFLLLALGRSVLDFLGTGMIDSQIGMGGNGHYNDVYPLALEFLAGDPFVQGGEDSDVSSRTYSLKDF